MGHPMMPQVLPPHGLPPPYFDPRGSALPQQQQPQQLDSLRNRLRNPSTTGNNGHRHRPAPPGRRWRGGQQNQHPPPPTMPPQQQHQSTFNSVLSAATLL